eukprot:c7818_g1_i2.p1 GENE.c7818_g1_i2~~c7818_g1_i2.p1  ORF type:complete len:139 (-),score=24.95 c7818_g1_i2:73-489(-)
MRTEDDARLAPIRSTSHSSVATMRAKLKAAQRRSISEGQTEQTKSSFPPSDPASQSSGASTDAKAIQNAKPLSAENQPTNSIEERVLIVGRPDVEVAVPQRLQPLNQNAVRALRQYQQQAANEPQKRTWTSLVLRCVE